MLLTYKAAIAPLVFFLFFPFVCPLDRQGESNTLALERAQQHYSSEKGISTSRKLTPFEFQVRFHAFAMSYLRSFFLAMNKGDHHDYLQSGLRANPIKYGTEVKNIRVWM